MAHDGIKPSSPARRPYVKSRLSPGSSVIATRFASAGEGESFIQGDIDAVQTKARFQIRFDREKTESRIERPIQPHRLTFSRGHDAVEGSPFESEAIRLQHGSVMLGAAGDRFFGIVENVQVREKRGVPGS